MSNTKVSLPKGMRDFGPETLRKRQYIIQTIKDVFELYGFMPIETPVMEKLSILNGKGGAESDKLLFKVLNNGDYLNKATAEDLTNKDSSKLLPAISEKGLRYDLTVPLARFVVMHQTEISFPFKRYQIQPVWRADRPQKGRYREFWQCDADVLGSDSLLNEVELIQIFSKVYSKLGIDVTIHLSTRKLLSAMVELFGKQEQITSFTVILDKLDKIGIDKVIEELEKIGFENEAFEFVRALNTNSSDFLSSETAAKIEQLPIGKTGIEELQYILSNLEDISKSKVKIDPSLARGLDYYTGPIFEIKTAGFDGSIGSGGRYDNLTGNFGLPGVSGVGISFGLDRMYNVMEEQNLFPNLLQAGTKVLFVNFDTETEGQVFQLTSQCRDAGIKSEFYPAAAKLKKQMKYANDKNIPYVVLAGSRELESGTLTMKNMLNGKQESLSIEQIIDQLK